MELTNLRVGTTMKTDFNDPDGFGFDAHVMEYPPSSASSFSSDSSFGPFTPTSGRSTPPGSDGLEINTSFTSSVDPYSFDLTPPSSAMSTYFHIGLKTAPEDACGFYQPPLLATPSRARLLESSDVAFRPDFNPHTPSQLMDFCAFTDGLGPSPLPLTPMRPVQGVERWDTWSMWVEPDTPLFDDRQHTPLQQSAIKREREPSLSCAQSGFNRRRLFDTAKGRATALQQIHQDSPLRVRRKPTRKEEDIFIVRGVEVTTISKERNYCNWPGCDKGFKKKEHLVRHVQSSHNGVFFQCRWCPKTFNRTDNCNSHEWLHADQRKSGRVKFVPEALRILTAEKALAKPKKLAKRRVPKI